MEMTNQFLKQAARLALAVAAMLPTYGMAAAPKECPPGLEADQPTVAHSVEQESINDGSMTFKEITKHGELLFVAKFNTCDGRGRPETTGGGDFRAMPTISEDGEFIHPSQVAKLRTSAPDADACAGCHNDPLVGAAGDFVANVFVLAQVLDPVTLSVSPSRSNSRNTLGMHGAGPIEMLAREMTMDLHEQFDAITSDGTYTLTSKGVDFEIEVVGGEVVMADGIDADLIVKPFHQAGKVISLREFSANAMNHHHGMQAEERFDMNPAKGFSTDFDNDGVERELTVGDLTAISIFQAQLGTPIQVRGKTGMERQQIKQGAQVFEDVGCGGCHVSEMVLESRFFVEPNPFNPPGTCAGPEDGCPVYAFDMTKKGEGSRLEKGRNGTAIVRAYTDLKRHNLCDDPGPGAIRWFCNEQLDQGRAGHDGKPGSEYFLTRKLWDVGNTAPYGHRGDISTITEAILMHGGDGRASRDSFASSSIADQKALVTFLKSLQIDADRTTVRHNKGSKTSK